MLDGNEPDYIAKFNDSTERLLRRGLIVSGLGDTATDALHDLLSSLYIIPINSRIWVKLMAFVKFIIINKMPFSKAKSVFRDEMLTKLEKRVFDLAKQTLLSTAELMKCVENNVYDFSDDNKVMDAIYNDDETTCDNIGYYAKLFSNQHSVLETVANLYLRKLIIFERV
jgi:hypothetical protein